MAATTEEKPNIPKDEDATKTTEEVSQSQEGTSEVDAVSNNPTKAGTTSQAQGSALLTLKGEVTQSALAKVLGLKDDEILAFRDYTTYVNVVTNAGQKIRVERSAK